MIDAILSNRLLTLHPDYFRLRRPFDRRIYQIARKHCGRQPRWEIGLAQLHAKSGSTDTVRHFRRRFRDFCGRWERNAEDPALGPFLDYDSAYDQERDVAVFVNRKQLGDGLDPSLLDDRTPAAFAAEFAELDQATMQRIWRAWSEGKAPPRDPQAAFLGFCRSWRKRRAAEAKEDAARGRRGNDAGGSDPPGRNGVVAGPAARVPPCPGEGLPDRRRGQGLGVHTDRQATDRARLPGLDRPGPAGQPVKGDNGMNVRPPVLRTVLVKAVEHFLFGKWEAKPYGGPLAV